MKTIQPWKILHTKDVSPSPFFPIAEDEVLLPNGHHTFYYKSLLADVSMVVPITKKNELIFVEQYKHGIGEVCIEFPAGRIEKGSNPKETAVLELEQETGIRIEKNKLEEIGQLWTEPSKSKVRVFGFLARNVEINSIQKLEDTENIKLMFVPLKKLDDMLRSGKIHASDTLALLLLFKMRFPDLF